MLKSIKFKCALLLTLFGLGMITPQKSEAGVGIIISGAMMYGSPHADEVVAVGVTLIALTGLAAAYSYDSGVWVPGLSPVLVGGLVLLDQTSENVTALQTAYAKLIPEITDPAIFKKLAAISINKLKTAEHQGNQFVVRFTHEEVEGILATSGFSSSEINEIAARLE